MDVLQRFAAVMASPRPRLDAALSLVAAQGRPEVDPDAVVEQLDDLAGAVPATVRRPEDLCVALFSPDGPVRLTGDQQSYYDARNSLLDQVLARRLGIPITLSVVGIEVARRRGLELEGIGMPGHFLLGDRTTGRFFDPFAGGVTLDATAARRRFADLHGPQQPFEPVYLDATPAGLIVARVLNNLRGAHLRSGDRGGLADALRLQAALPGASLSARRDLAGVLAADGRFLEAAGVHDGLAADDPGAAEEHHAAALRLRARLN